MCTCWRSGVILLLAACLAGCSNTAGGMRWWTKKKEACNCGVSVGQSAPEIEGADLDSKPFKLSDYRGQVVLLDYWATWCGYCVRMFPQERALIGRMTGRPFVMLGVDVKDDRESAVQMARSGQVTWRNWFDPAGCISDAWGVQVYPTIFLIDHQGTVRAVYRGAPGEEFEAKIEELVREAEGARKMVAR